MELLSLALIGWLYALGAGFALALGAWLIVGFTLRSESAVGILAG